MRSLVFFMSLCAAQGCSTRDNGNTASAPTEHGMHHAGAGFAGTGDRSSSGAASERMDEAKASAGGAGAPGGRIDGSGGTPANGGAGPIAGAGTGGAAAAGMNGAAGATISAGGTGANQAGASGAADTPEQPDSRAAEVPPAGTQAIDRPTPKGCITDVGPGNRLVLRDCGQNIVFNVSVPQQCMEKACGLIFDVHGYSMNGVVQEENTNLARLGREKSYVVVQPSAPNASWMPAAHNPVVIEFMNLAIDVWHIEKRRVHITGFSQGGRMTWQLRCTLSKTIASAAPIAMSSVPCDAGLPAREMPLLYTQGESDSFVGEGVGVKVAQAYIGSHKMQQDKVISSDSQYTWTRYAGEAGLVFEFIDHKYSTSSAFGAGHCFPGSFSSSSPYACRQSAPFHFGEAVMDFFIAHPMD